MLYQLLFSATALGASYAMVAIGFSLLWQTSQVINFAQGDFVAVSAFTMLVFYALLGLSFPLALILTCLVCAFVLGFLFRRIIVQRLIEKGLLSLVCATIVLSLLIQNALIFYSPEAQLFPSIVSKEGISILNIRLSHLDILNIILAVVTILGLQLFIRRTMIGKALQAVAQNRDAAVVLGIDVPKMITLAFVINAILTILAAIMIAPTYGAKYSMGGPLGLRAFYAAIIGGFNQTRGALLGGLLVGYIEIFTILYITSEYSEAIILLILIAVILFKPEGLWGTKELWSKAD